MYSKFCETAFNPNKRQLPGRKVVLYGLIMFLIMLAGCGVSDGEKPSASAERSGVSKLPRPVVANPVVPVTPRLDTALYNKQLLYLSHGVADAKWPVKTAYPLPGAILPFKRIVAFYGNFYSEGMGILGALPPDEMLEKLKGEVKKWNEADSMLPVVPAIHYIAVSAQRNPGKNSAYRLRMPFKEIDKALALANKVNGILFLDVQVGHSNVEQEIPELEPYLKLPNVHLGIDPEFSMKGGQVPCSTIGTMDAKDINFASEYLAALVNKYKLPPKILVVHRFNKDMVTNAKQITLHPEVQIVMNMDGFGFAAKKVNSYKTAIVAEPVQFTGFKLFYKNDILTKGSKLMEPADIAKLNPIPVYIQYQ